jgi:hypothetical protein
MSKAMTAASASKAASEVSADGDGATPKKLIGFPTTCFRALQDNTIFPGPITQIIVGYATPPMLSLIESFGFGRPDRLHVWELPEEPDYGDILVGPSIKEESAAPFLLSSCLVPTSVAEDDSFAMRLRHQHATVALIDSQYLCVSRWACAMCGIAPHHLQIWDVSKPSPALRQVRHMPNHTTRLSRCCIRDDGGWYWYGR